MHQLDPFIVKHKNICITFKVIYRAGGVEKENLSIEGCFYESCLSPPLPPPELSVYTEGSPCQEQHQLWMSFYLAPSSPPSCSSPADFAITSYIFPELPYC